MGSHLSCQIFHSLLVNGNQSGAFIGQKTRDMRFCWLLLFCGPDMFWCIFTLCLRVVLVFGLSLDSHFVSACSSNFAPGGGTNIFRFDTSTAPKEVPITVALGTNVCDVFVFVLAHVLVSLVAKSLRQDLSHAAQASKMNDCSGLVKLSGGIASHICFRFQNLQCFVASTPSKNFTEANRLPFQGQNSSKEGTEAEKGLEKTPIVLNITLEFSRTTSGDGIRMNAC